MPWVSEELRCRRPHANVCPADIKGWSGQFNNWAMKPRVVVPSTISATAVMMDIWLRKSCYIEFMFMMPVSICCEHGPALPPRPEPAAASACARTEYENFDLAGR